MHQGSGVLTQGNPMEHSDEHDRSTRDATGSGDPQRAPGDSRQVGLAPMSGLAIIGLLVGVSTLFRGVSWLMLGFALRKIPKPAA